MTRKEIIDWKPYMKESDFTTWAGQALGMKGSVPGKEDITAALNAARVKVEGKGPYATTPKADTNGVFAKKYQQMLDLSRRYYDVNQKLPDAVELDKMATALHLSADDAWHSTGFEGTLGELISDPKSVQLDPSQPRDMGLLSAAASIARSNAALGPVVLKTMGLPAAKKLETIGPEAYANYPELVGMILELGLLTNAPMESAVAGRDPVGFLDAAAAKAENQRGK